MIEHELRFALTPSMVAEFEQRTAIGLAGPSAGLRSRYFDTPAGDLMKAALSLRVRQTPQGFVQSLRTAGGGRFERFEWAAPVSGEQPELDALPPADHPAGAHVRACFDLLAVVFETRFERQLRLVRPQPGVRAELACDRGEISAGARSEQVAEVELVRREGPAAAFYHYAMQWASLHRAQLVLSSKSLRGLRLAGYAPPQPRPPLQGQPAPPLAALSVAGAARLVLRGHLDGLLDSMGPLLAVQDDGRAAHQFHLSLQRFRTAIRFFGLHGAGIGGRGYDAGAARDADPTLGAARVDDTAGDSERDAVDPSTAWRHLRREARPLARAALLADRIDSLANELLPRLQAAFPGDPAVRLLERSLVLERERHRAGLREAVRASELTGFILKALAAIELLPSDRWPGDRCEPFALARLQALVRRLRRRTCRTRRSPRTAGDDPWREVAAAAGRLSDAIDGCRPLQLTALPVDEAVAMLSRWQGRTLPPCGSGLTRALAARVRSAPDAPGETATRAVALLDGYLAGAVGDCPPQELRESILAESRRLIRPLPERRGDAAAMPPAADRVSRSGYHPESPPLRAPAAQEAALPLVDPWKEDPE